MDEKLLAVENREGHGDKHRSSIVKGVEEGGGKKYLFFHLEEREDLY